MALALLAARFGAGLATYRSRPLPEVLLIGAQKSGTTSLHNYLSQHPAALPALRKGVHFFDFHRHRGLAWYRAHFPTGRERAARAAATGMQPLTAEASPYYLFHPRAPAAAHAVLPGARLVAVLRDPVDRAYSHYHHERRAGREPLEPAEAFEREPARLAGEEERLLADPRYYGYEHHRHSYLARGRYDEQIERWLRHFPASQLCVVGAEELFRAPAATMERVFAFLGLPDHRLPAYETHGPRGSYSEIDRALRARLADYFRPHNQALFARIGRDLAWQ